ncbi:Acyltransferase 3 [Rhodobacteraceae bacterium HTCC2150]|nr:Acyltransferase 3 [Rhodobacteraceae bacterium HTCC2150]
MKYRPEIDGLRAIAVVSVILFHSGYSFLAGGYFGVDIFFVISGYLITTIISSEIAAGKFSLRNFYERRARRILPALFLVVLCCIPLAWLFLLPYEMKDFAESVFTVATFSSNILFWSESGYFARVSETKPLLHTWSLAIEEQYYLVFPLLLLVLNRLRRINIFYVLIGLTVASLIYAQIRFQSDQSAAFFLILPRAWELLVGSLAALIHLEFGQSLGVSKLRGTLSLVGLLLIMSALLGIVAPTGNHNLVPIVPVFGAFLILMFAEKDIGIGRFLGLGLFVGIGLISYSAYLWHQPFLAFSKVLVGDEVTHKIAPFLIAATFICAIATWKFVETPFRQQKRISTRVLYLTLGPIFFVLLSFGLYGHLKDGISSRLSETKRVLTGDIEHLEFHKLVFDEFHTCRPENIAKAALTSDGYLRCVQSKENDDMNVVLLGDSHAEHLFLGLAEEMKFDNIVFYIKGAFASVYEPRFSEIFEVLENSRSTEITVLSMHWLEKVRQPPGGKSFAENLKDTIEFLGQNSGLVVLLDDIPRFPFVASECKHNLPFRPHSGCSISRGFFDEQKSKFSNELMEIANNEDKVTYFSLDHLFCDAENCSMANENTIFYRDNNHLNIPGSRMVGKFLAPKLNELRTEMLNK